MTPVPTIGDPYGAPYEVRAHLCVHRRRSCPLCPRCFHDRHRCSWCFKTKSGLPAPVPRVRLRCAACGRYRPKTPVIDIVSGVASDLCPRCTDRGLEALTLF